MNARFIIFFVIATIIHGMIGAQNVPYSFKLLTGEELTTILPFIAAQRIAVFSEYPYLYKGDEKEERDYCERFASLSRSAVAVAYRGSEPVGFISGTRFVDFDEHFKGSIKIFEKYGLDPQRFYYIPEGIIVPEERHNSLITKLQALIEEHAKKIGHSACCFVEESHDTHPLKPAEYQSLKELFEKLGYKKTTAKIKFAWDTLQPDGSSKKEQHTMYYWTKDL